MLKFAVRYEGPIAIRYPRGEAYDGLEEYREPVLKGRSEMIYEGGGTALLAVGSMVKTAKQVHDMLQKDGNEPTLVNARFVKPLDTKMLDNLAKHHRLLVTMEENVKSGGFGSAVQDYMCRKHPEIRMITVALPDAFMEHGGPEELKKKAGIDAHSIYKRIKEAE